MKYLLLCRRDPIERDGMILPAMRKAFPRRKHKTRCFLYCIYLPTRRIITFLAVQRVYAFNVRRMTKKKNRRFTISRFELSFCVHPEYTRMLFWA